MDYSNKDIARINWSVAERAGQTEQALFYKEIYRIIVLNLALVKEVKQIFGFKSEEGFYLL